MKPFVEDAVGAAMLAMSWLLMFFAAGFAQAGGMTLNLVDGEGFRINCDNGKIVSMQSPGVISWVCEKNGDPDPDPEPDPDPTECADAHPPIRTVGVLDAGQTEMRLKGGESTVLRFSSNDLASGSISFAPYPGDAVPRCTEFALSVSMCKGVFDKNTVPRNCMRVSGEGGNTIRLSTAGSGGSACSMSKGAIYWASLSPYNPFTEKVTQAGACAIVLRVQKN